MNLICTSRVSELGLSHKATTKDEEDDATLIDLDHTESHPLECLRIDYQGSHHGHSPQSVEAPKFFVFDDAQYGILLGRRALNDLHVFALDPLYSSSPSRHIPKERILTVTEGECGNGGHTSLVNGREFFLQGKFSFQANRPRVSQLQPSDVDHLTAMSNWLKLCFICSGLLLQLASIFLVVQIFFKLLRDNKTIFS